MKYSYFLFAILSLSLFGCTYTESNTVQVIDSNNESHYVVIIDSCEYLTGSREARATGYLSHKGNCRFCERQLSNLTDSVQ